MTAVLGAAPAAARARQQATVVAAFGAAVPTVLAAQGMASLATDLLGFPVVVAVALASFLELALVSSALLARAAALAGRPGGPDAAAVWVVSATSGLLAGTHELVGLTAGGGSTWETDPGALLAAVVRAVAPLVAAWLWERVLQAARAEQAERTLTEVRRDRRLLEVARAALAVRRLDGPDTGRTASRRLRRARRRLDRAHLAALRVVPPGVTLADVLMAVGQVDHLPAATAVAPLLSSLDTFEGPARQDGARSDSARSAQMVHAAMTSAGRTASVSAPIGVGSDVADRSGRTGPVTGEQERRLFPEPAPSGARQVCLDVAADLVRADRRVSGVRVAEELARRGRPVSVRTGQRLRNRALADLNLKGAAEQDPVLAP